MTQISKDYASALFSLAKETNTINDVYENVNFLNDVFNENPRYTELLGSPAIDIDERIEMFSTALKGSVTKIVHSFVCILITNGHINNFAECIEDYTLLYEEYKNISTAYIKSAVELSENDIKRITEKLENISGKTVIAETMVDPSVLGGIIVELDGKVFDGSLKHKLKTAKEVMGK